MPKPGSSGEFAELIGVSDATASRILNGRSVPSIDRALLIYDKTGRKMGRLANLSAREIDRVRAMVGQ